jgi:hypothetical protein
MGINMVYDRNIYTRGRTHEKSFINFGYFGRFFWLGTSTGKNSRSEHSRARKGLQITS